jgi:antitoxin component YwqK of YwqJK toxin-antitoxin module
MKRITIALSCMFLFGACSKSPQDDIVRTSYYHAYGPEVNAEDWKAQGSSGEIVQTLKNGVEVRKEYENGLLQGTSSWTFPYSKVVERVEEYHLGKRMLVGRNFENGSPEIEEEWEPGDRRIVHAWYPDGSPRLLEEFNQGRIVEGKYFTLEGEVEGSVSSGHGLRVERSGAGQLSLKEEVRSGDVMKREIFFPNGQLQEVVLFQGNKRHGECKRYAENGQTVAVENWCFGVLDGTQIFFEGGLPVRQVPYVLGKREGTELHFRSGTEEVIEEIAWHNDVRHGLSKTYVANHPITEWYWRGGKVTETQYKERNEGALLTSR